MMNTLLWLLLMPFSVAIAFKQLAHRNHTCAPSSGYSKICVLGSLHYRARETHVIHSFPRNQSHVRITSNSLADGGSLEVLYINSDFYKKLGRPETLEVFNYAVLTFVIGRTLRHASIPKSFMMSLRVEPGEDDPKIGYLDLSRNMLRHISAVGSLVNLEVLLLSKNSIESIDPSTMKNLTKLRYLTLSHNRLTDVSLGIFPKSLIHLELFNCKIDSLNYEDLNYPNLETLDIEENHLTAIDGRRLIQAMPSLKLARIGWNHYQEDGDDLLDTIRILKAHNISFRNGADEAACEQENSVEGICLKEPDLRRTILPDVLMSLAVIAVAILLVGVLRWVLIAMNSK